MRFWKKRVPEPRPVYNDPPFDEQKSIERATLFQDIGPEHRDERFCQMLENQRKLDDLARRNRLERVLKIVNRLHARVELVEAELSRILWDGK